MKPVVKKLVTVTIPLLAIALIGLMIFWPYRHVAINQQEITLTVGTDIITDQIQANTPFVIKLDNSYQAKIQILSSYPINLTYGEEIIKSIPIKDNFSSSQQIIEYELPVVKGEMNFGRLPGNTQIRLTSDNSYFGVVYYKPTKYLGSDMFLFIIIVMMINGLTLMTRHIFKKE